MSAPAQSPGNGSVRIPSPPHPSQFSKTLTLARRGGLARRRGKEGPKWNKRAPRFLSICAAVEPARRGGSKPSSIDPRPCPPHGASSTQNPNRNTPKLKSSVTHTKQSPGQFLIATFRALVRRAAANIGLAGRPSPTPALIAIKTAARKLEILLTRVYSATSKFLIDNFSRVVQTYSVAESNQDGHSRKDRRLFLFAPQCARTSSLRHLASSLQPARRGGNSNRKIYEKLEILVTYTKQTPALISNRKEMALHPRCSPFHNRIRGELI
jgi:hypothetical protein